MNKQELMNLYHKKAVEAMKLIERSTYGDIVQWLLTNERDDVVEIIHNHIGSLRWMREHNSSNEWRVKQINTKLSILRGALRDIEDKEEE